MWIEPDQNPGEGSQKSFFVLVCNEFHSQEVSLMLKGKFIKLRHLIVAGITMSILLQGCTYSTFSAGGGKDLLPDDPVPPTTPRPVAEAHEEIEIRITPILNEEYLPNPGMGWQDGPETFGIMNFPETVAYSNRREIAWSVLNPAKGVFDWSALDTQLNRAVQAGKQFSFRVYTFVGEGYDGNKIPAWVFTEGATLLPSGEPDYSNCTYQKEWGTFVNELIRVYDGNPDIAFIDISGYGNFNEWSWQDTQTEWDEQWEADYTSGTPTGESFQTLDGQARRRLADIFIGGSFEGHGCRMPNGEVSHVDYSYQGFQKTQLLMPYAGIVQSSQYVLSRRSDVGFRHDCLGRDGRLLFEKIGNEILRTWVNAPIVYELCKPYEVDTEDAKWLLQMTHGSIVHNNNWSYSFDQLEEMMMQVGYQYFLKEMSAKIKDRRVDVQMEWLSVGLAPNYPKMGQEFSLYFYLVDDSGKVFFKDPVPADISTWLPAGSVHCEQPSYRVSYKNQLPASLISGKYLVGISIIDLRTGTPIHLPFGDRNANGVNILFPIQID